MSISLQSVWCIFVSLHATWFKALLVSVVVVCVWSPWLAMWFMADSFNRKDSVGDLLVFSFLAFLSHLEFNVQPVKDSANERRKLCPRREKTRQHLGDFWLQEGVTVALLGLELGRKMKSMYSLTDLQGQLCSDICWLSLVFYIDLMQKAAWSMSQCVIQKWKVFRVFTSSEKGPLNLSVMTSWGWYHQLFLLLYHHWYVIIKGWCMWMSSFQCMYMHTVTSKPANS